MSLGKVTWLANFRQVLMKNLAKIKLTEGE